MKQFGEGAIDTENSIPVGAGTETYARIYVLQLLSERQ